MRTHNFDLEERLVKFAGDVILFLKTIPNDKPGSTLGGQMIRSATSTALNYGEAQGGESTKDKIHKLSVVLKELKETRVAMKILAYINYGDLTKRTYLLTECGELAAIIATMIKNNRNKL
jgi:four helix bundle protein